MEAKYYDLESTMAKYADSPQAAAFLQGVVERSCPDAFHQCDVETARALAMQDEIAQTVRMPEMERAGTITALYLTEHGAVYAYKMHIFTPSWNADENKEFWTVRARLTGKNVCTRSSIKECVGFVDYQISVSLCDYYKTGL